MKISDMLLREDFYRICDETLKAYYEEKSTVPTRLYIYPELNAIITKHPSKAVKRFLYTEYRVNAGILKRTAVFIYTRLLLNTSGLFASKRITLNTDAGKDTLIYPCNKKIRIFSFDKNEVSVTVKSGFPTGCLENEIAFRLGNCAGFIPPLKSSNDTSYTERIIDGYPLARAGKNTEALSQKAFALWQAYIAPSVQYVGTAEYAEKLRQQIKALLGKENVISKEIDVSLVEKTVTELCGLLGDSKEQIRLVKSHGDLQPGNIWIENGTDRIIIIDWESFAVRSEFYDRALLFGKLRTIGGAERYLEEKKDAAHAAVILEDIVFRLGELNGLPGTDGKEAFGLFINNIYEIIRSSHV